MTDEKNDAMPDIVKRLGEACIGAPYAKIPWPHRLLHDAIAEIERLEALTLRQPAADNRGVDVESVLREFYRTADLSKVTIGEDTVLRVFFRHLKKCGLLRTTPDDAGGDELDVHDRLRHMTDDFKMSQHQCRHQSEQISALQVELAQAKAALRQPAAADMINIGHVYDGMRLPKRAVINPDYTASIPAAADNRGVDVERFSPYATDYFGAPSVEWEKDENGDWVKYEDLITKGLLRTTARA